MCLNPRVPLRQSWCVNGLKGDETRLCKRSVLAGGAPIMVAVWVQVCLGLNWQAQICWKGGVAVEPSSGIPGCFCGRSCRWHWTVGSTWRCGGSRTILQVWEVPWSYQTGKGRWADYLARVWFGDISWSFLNVYFSVVWMCFSKVCVNLGLKFVNSIWREDFGENN